MRTATAWATVTNVTSTFRRLWPLAKRYWFDALVVAGIAASIAVAVADQHNKDGPDGPLWFDVLASIAFLVPFFFRRRYPFGAPVAVGVLIAAISFVDTGFVNDEFATFPSGIAAAFMFGMLKERSQALAGGRSWSAWSRSSPTTRETTPGDFVFPSIVFGVAWIFGFASARSFARAPRRRSGQSASSASARNRHGSRSPRSGRGSRASCTTSSATASAS